MEHDEASRIVNGWLWGDPTETLCSRVWRWRWLVPGLWLLLDYEARRRWGEEPGHCRRAAETHRARKPLPEEPDARVRIVQEG